MSSKKEDVSERGRRRESPSRRVPDEQVPSPGRRGNRRSLERSSLDRGARRPERSDSIRRSPSRGRRRYERKVDDFSRRSRSHGRQGESPRNGRRGESPRNGRRGGSPRNGRRGEIVGDQRRGRRSRDDDDLRRSTRDFRSARYDGRTRPSERVSERVSDRRRPGGRSRSWERRHNDDRHREVERHHRRAERSSSSSSSSESEEDGKDLTEDQLMAKLMGVTNFDTTKGKNHSTSDLSGVNKKTKRKYRQYMNRRGGFNRPLSPVH